MIRIPNHLQPLEESVVFDPKVHLALESPKRVWTLEDFGYTKAQVARANFPLAVTAPFRILSQAGVKALRDAIAAIKDHRGSDRIAKFIRGSVYRSKFIRDFCTSPEVNGFLGQIAGRPLLPHPMPLYQGHINLMPDQKGRDVDKWHTDTVSLDYVILVSDRSAFEGGHFEYLQSTRNQAIRHLIREEEQAHSVKVDFPAAGYAVLQQGNLVVHRGAAVTRGTERTTFVQSFVPDDPDFNDVSKLDDCRPVDPHDVLFTEWSRYKAFLSKRRLEKLIDEIPYTEDRNLLCTRLRRAVRDVEEAILELSDESEARLVHFGQDALTDPS